VNIVFTDFAMQTQSYDIFFSGCSASPKCTDCHNPEAWDFNCGEDWETYKKKMDIDLRTFRSVIKKIFILGGDPLDQDPTEFKKFMEWINLYDYEIWLFTRYEINEISDETKALFDYIKCGRYLPEQSTENNIQYGVKLATANQNIYKRGEHY
jgi:anaerobic ribonucleoside-triphosphate reductase activating protein